MTSPANQTSAGTNSECEILRKYISIYIQLLLMTLLAAHCSMNPTDDLNFHGAEMLENSAHRFVVSIRLWDARFQWLTIRLVLIRCRRSTYVFIEPDVFAYDFCSCTRECLYNLEQHFHCRLADIIANIFIS